MGQLRRVGVFKGRSLNPDRSLTILRLESIQERQEIKIKERWREVEEMQRKTIDRMDQESASRRGEIMEGLESWRGQKERERKRERGHLTLTCSRMVTYGHLPRPRPSPPTRAPNYQWPYASSSSVGNLPRSIDSDVP